MQKYIAKETLQVFAPLAKLLGMYRIKVCRFCVMRIYAVSFGNSTNCGSL